MNDEFHSYDPETGVLQDIEEIRTLGLALVELLSGMLANPVVQMSLPMSLLGRCAGACASSISALRQTSQAEHYRIIARIIGLSEKDARDATREFGLSETYPNQHKKATPPDAALEHFMDSEGVDPVSLPPSIEEFLKSLEG